MSPLFPNFYQKNIVHSLILKNLNFSHTGGILAVTAICPKSQRDEWLSKRHKVMGRKWGKATGRYKKKRGADGGRESEKSSGACQTINVMVWARGSWWHKRWVDIFSIVLQMCTHIHTKHVAQLCRIWQTYNHRFELALHMFIVDRP